VRTGLLAISIRKMARQKVLFMHAAPWSEQ